MTKNVTTESINLMRLPEVINRTGMGKSSIYKLIKAKRFPVPIHPGESRISAWIESEIDDWLTKQIEKERDSVV